MTRISHVALVLVLAAACGGKKDDSAQKTAPAEPPKTTEPVAPTKAEPPPPPPAAKLVETDLSAFGPDWKGVVAMVPEGAKVEFDDPSRHITLSDKDFVSISEAAYWEDGVGGLSKDPDNKNIKKVSDTVVTYERTPPLGTAWAADVLVKIGKSKWSCTPGDPGTFTSAAMRDSIVEICKSIKKK